MTKILRVDDDVHEIISTMAKYDDRKLSAFLNKFFRDMKDGSFNEGLRSLWYAGGTVREDKFEARGITPPSPEKYEAKTPKNNFEATPVSVDVSDLFATSKPPVVKDFPDFEDNEDECCKHPTQPCKHWVWDTQTGEGYRNSLSGRYREAD
jgi:hypothetical protein